MSNFVIDISYGWLLLLLIPAVALTLLPYFRMNKHYRRNRNRVVSIVLHLTVMFLCVFTLSGMTFHYDTPNTENEILLLVDASFSSREAEDKKEEFISNVIGDGGDNYKVGIVKFGYDQKYVAKLSNDTREVYRQYVSSEDPNTSATDIAAALRFAAGLVSNPSTAKIVLISDGVETDGNAMAAIKSVAAQGTKVDVVCLAANENNELQITGVETPLMNLDVDSEFVLQLQINSNFGGKDKNVAVTLYDNGEEGATVSAELKSGKQTLEIPHTFSSKGMHELRFEAKDSVSEGDGDTVEQNNKYITYIYLDEYDNILFLEKEKDESQQLQLAFMDMGKTVTVYTMDIEEERQKVPSDIETLAEFDQVVLVNIANSDMPEGFDAILYDYVNRLGGGLFTVGGKNDEVDGKLVPHAYNREDLRGTLYQQMLPVQAVDYTPPVAVVVAIDTSGSMSDRIGNCKTGARAVLDALNTWDYMGVMTFADSSAETMDITPVSQKDKIRQRIDGISEYNSGGTVFAAAVNRAGAALNAINAPRKHIMVITDGQPGDYADFVKEIEKNRESNITLSVIVSGSIGADERANMIAACNKGGGQFLQASSASDFASMAFEDLKTNVVEEIKYGEEFSLQIETQASPVVKGITQAELDEIKFTGYYGTRLKEDAEAPVTAQMVPMYAQWDFGKGKVGSFMCDLGGEWSGEFLNSDAGKKFLNNVVTGIFPVFPIMPPDMEVKVTEDNYTTQLNVYTQLGEGDTLEVKVTPLSSEAEEFYSKDSVKVTAYDGNTRFAFDVICAGLYKIEVIKTSAEKTSVYTMYKALAYSKEYDVLGESEISGSELMTEIAAEGDGIVATDALDIFDSFVKVIHKDVDPRMVFLIIAVILFLLDIAVRKFKFKWPHEIIRDRKAKKALKSEAKR